MSDMSDLSRGMNHAPVEYIETNTRLVIERVFCGRKHRLPTEVARTASKKVAAAIISSAGRHKEAQTFFYTLDSMKEYFGPTEDTVIATRRVLKEVGLHHIAAVAESMTK